MAVEEHEKAQGAKKGFKEALGSVDWGNYLPRILIMTVGVAFIGAAVALSKRALTGTSPISCIPAVTFDILQDQNVPIITLGMLSFLMNAACLVVELIILKKSFPPLQLLQLAITFALGFFIDLWMPLCNLLPNDAYPIQLAILAVSVCFLALGVVLETKANVLMTPGDALVGVIAKARGHEYHKVKVRFDCTLMAIGVALSLLYFGHLGSAREGTIIAAVCTGLIIPVWERILRPLIAHFPSTDVNPITPVI